MKLLPVNIEALKEKTPTRRKLKRRIRGGVAAGIVSAGIVLSNLFGSPAELVNPNEAHLANRPAVVQMVDLDVEEEEADDEGKEKVQPKKRAGTRIKEWILSLPVAVRAIVGVPLWAAGWILTCLLSPLLQGLGGYLLPVIIKFAVLLAVLFLVVFLTAKALHPDMPAKEILKKMFRRKNPLYLILGAVVLTVLDSVLLFALEDYAVIRRVIIFLIGLVILFLILRPFITKAIKKRKSIKQAGHSLT